MLKNVTITEPPGLMVGSLNTMLHNMGVQQFQEVSPGVTKAQFTDAQVSYFKTRGFSYKLEVEEVPVVDPKDARISELEATVENRDSQIADLKAIATDHEQIIGNLQTQLSALKNPPPKK